MPGLSFLVSPQTQEEAAATAKSFQNAYDQAEETQRASDAQDAAADRAEQAQKAAEARQSQRDQAMFLMQAQRQDQILKRFEEGKNRATTTASIMSEDKERDRMYALGNDTYKQITDAKTARDYDQDFLKSYTPKVRQSLANGLSWYDEQKAKFNATAKPGDTFVPDWRNSPFAFLEAPHLNASYARSPELREQDLVSKINYRAANFDLAAKKFGYAISKDKQKLFNQAFYASNVAETAQKALEDYTKTLPANAIVADDEVYKKLFTAAASAKNNAAGMNAVLAKEPGIPPDILKVVGSPDLLDRYGTPPAPTSPTQLPQYNGLGDQSESQDTTDDSDTKTANDLMDALGAFGNTGTPQNQFLSTFK